MLLLACRYMSMTQAAAPPASGMASGQQYEPPAPQASQQQLAGPFGSRPAQAPVAQPPAAAAVTKHASVAAAVTAGAPVAAAVTAAAPSIVITAVAQQQKAFPSFDGRGKM